MRFYARFVCGNPHFDASGYKISYDTRAKNVFLTSVTHTRQKTFHRTRIVMYYYFGGYVKDHNNFTVFLENFSIR